MKSKSPAACQISKIDLIHVTVFEMNSILDQVVTVSDAAEIYGCSDRYIRKLCELKKIEAKQDKKGNWLILKSSLPTKEEIK